MRGGLWFFFSGVVMAGVFQDIMRLLVTLSRYYNIDDFARWMLWSGSLWWQVIV